MDNGPSDRDSESNRERNDDHVGFRVVAGRERSVPPIKRFRDGPTETNPQDEEAQPPARAHDGSVTPRRESPRSPPPR